MLYLLMWTDHLRSRLEGERGQATAEYALVLIAAAAIAVALITWASSSGTLRAFFEAVMRRIRAYV